MMRSLPRLMTVMVIALGIAMASALPCSAASPWPGAEQWIPSYHSDWSSVVDPTTIPAYSSPYVDCVTDLTHPSSAGSFWYVSGGDMSDMTLFIRIVVDGNPVRGSGNTMRLRENMWLTMIDSTGNQWPDWSVCVDGSNDPDRIRTWYNTGSDIVMDAATGWAQVATETPYTSAGFTYLVNGMVRVSQVTSSTSLRHNGTADYYIDVQVPLSWLSRPNGSNPGAVTPSTPLKLASGSSSRENSISLDLVGLNAILDVDTILGNVPRVSPESAFTGGYGTVRNSRHVWSVASSGTWLLGETVTFGGAVNSIPLGYGWPNSSSPYYTGSLCAQVRDPEGSIVWQGNIATDASGNIASTATWKVAAGGLDGVYSLYVANPKVPSVYELKDTFTVSKYDLSRSTKTVNKVIAGAREELTYTIVVRNTGARESPAVTVRDVIPAMTRYVPGSTTLGGSTLADQGGQCPLVSGLSLGALAVGASRTITFRVTVDAEAPDRQAITNTATLTWNGGTLQRSASTTVSIPVVTVTKSVNLERATPGDELLYTTVCTNSGSATATGLVLVDEAPAETAYVAGSATRGGAGMQLEFRHSANGAYDASEAAPVVGMRWLITALAPQASITLQFRAVIK